MQIAGKTDVGSVRTHNEDNFCIGDSFAVISDGMGGHSKGEVASGMIINSLKTSFSNEAFENTPDTVKSIVSETNRQVYAKSMSDETFSGMGATVVCCTWDEKKILISHVGDSRCYRITGKEITRLTKDHSLVQHLLDENRITVEEAKVHPQRHVITRALGTEPEETVDVAELKRKKDKILLLCSDGLSNMVSEQQMLDTVHNATDLNAAAEQLIEAAKAAGGTDNITVVLIQF